MKDDKRTDLTIDDGDEPLCNHSGNRPFAEVLETRLDRRSVLKGGAGMAAVSLFGLSLAGCGGSSSSKKNDNVGGGDDTGGGDQGPQPRLLGFDAVPVSMADTIVVPEGYKYHVLMPWGEPIVGGAAAFAWDNTGADQGGQVGMHHDGMHFFPIEGNDPYEGSSTDGLLVMNHEYIEPRFMHEAAKGQAFTRGHFPVKQDGTRDADQVLKEMNAHGVSIARISKGANNHWSVEFDGRNRRVTATTPMEIRGPVRGSDLVKTKYSNDGTMTRGTLNNCAHGVTPWGTYLAAEENWASYFRNGAVSNSDRDADGRPAAQWRYGVRTANNDTSRYAWELADQPGPNELYHRFDVTPVGADATADYRNEANCFGWMVEIDPFEPTSTPVKRTALGRFAHEGVVFQPAEEGKPIVCYSGDDAQFEYIYKFVSTNNYYKSHGKANAALLDEGTLYVARFNDDGSGEWIPLVYGEGKLTAANGFGSQADVLVNTRLAADTVGATPMDRPEWGAVDPATRDVYFTLTNNSRRGDEGRPGVDEANPRGPNPHGHIIRWAETGGNAAALSFDWDIFAFGGDTSGRRDPDGVTAGFDGKGDPLTEDNIFSSPDGLWIDKDSRIWIQMDMSESVMNTNPTYWMMGNNGMLAADPNTGDIRRFLTGPIGQEITGVITTPDQRTMFINVQHPGATTGAEEWAAGKVFGSWPDHNWAEGGVPPRSATVVIWREDGGIIGA